MSSKPGADRWEKFLRATGGALPNDGLEHQLHRFVTLCRERAIEDVVDLGAGSGQVSLPLLRAGLRVRCVDGHGPSLRQLRSLLDDDLEQRAEIEHCDFEGLRLPQRGLHAVIAVRSLNHGGFNDVVMRFRRVAESLRPGGLLLLYIAARGDFRHNFGQRVDGWTTVPTDGPEEGIPHVFPSERELHAWLPGLRAIELKRHNFPVPRASPYFEAYSRLNRSRMRRKGLVSSHHVLLAERPARPDRREVHDF